MTAATTRRPSQTWLSRADCDIAEFRALVEVPTDLADYPHADAVNRNVLNYGSTLCAALTTGTDAGSDLRDIKAELHLAVRHQSV